jgi:hypothetical protein
MGLTMRRAVIAVMGALLAFVLVSCGGGDGESSGPTATPNEQQARTIAENMLTAYNSGDYGAFSRDWSSAMKLVIGEDEFREYRDKTLPLTGQYVKLTSLTPTGDQDNEGHLHYDIQAEFEKRDAVLFTMTLSSDNAEVEGIELKSQS